MRYLERYIILNAIDRLWQEHLYAMDSLREAVYLRAYGQKDPLIEYKTEAYDMFTELMANIKSEILHNLFRSTSNLEAFGAFLAEPSAVPHQRRRLDQRGTDGLARKFRGDGDRRSEPAPHISFPVRREAPKVGRNDPCPCGSGKKFKNCCGKPTAETV